MPPIKKRCVVPGCSSALEEITFQRRMTTDGHAWCPRHKLDTTRCGCTTTSRPFTFHKFPESPGLRSVWISLIGVRTDMIPSRSEFVCSKHFDTAGARKVPTKDIGKSNEDIRTILEENAQRMINRRTERNQASRELTKRSMTKLADAVADVVVALEKEETAEETGDVSCIESLFNESAGTSLPHASSKTTSTIVLCPDSAPHIQREKYPVWTSFPGPSSTTPPQAASDVDSLSQEMEDVSIDDDEIPQQALKRTTPALRTPESVSKRLCNKKSPNSVLSSRECQEVACIAKKSECQALKRENQRLQIELHNQRVRLLLVEKKANEPCPECPREKAAVAALKEELAALRDSMNLLPTADMPRKPTIIDTARIDDDRFFALTGMKLPIFRIMFKTLEPYARRSTYWQGPAKTTTRKNPVAVSEKTSIEFEQEFILFLMRLRLNINYELLAQIFGCGTTKVSSVFNTWLDLFSRQFSWMITMPDQWTSWSRLPPHVANKFPRLRCIVDCTEVEIQHPKSPYLQCITYSNYKKRNTIKFLVAILGDGAIAFVSKAFTGRTSDKFIMNYCGLMNLLAAGDQVLADRGFSITDEMLLRSIDLNTPPAATGVVQFTSEQVLTTKKIANVRIHVERAIRRMKCYSMLSGVIPITVLPVIDKVITSVAILCNLQEDLVK